MFSDTFSSTGKRSPSDACSDCCRPIFDQTSLPFLSMTYHAGDGCQEGVPPLRLVGPGHHVACWVDVKARAASLSA